MKKQKKNSKVQCIPKKYSKKGDSLAFVDELTQESGEFEIPFTLVGEKIEAKIYRKKRKRYLCSLENILESSPQRVVPRCKHVGTCGGCRWQQISYQEQIRLKEEIVATVFSSLTNTEKIQKPIIPCSPPWRYRNKMEFTFSTNKNGDKFLGLVMHGTRGKILTLEECHLVNPWMIEGLDLVRKWWERSEIDAYHPWKDSGSLRNLIVREGLRTGNRMVVLQVSGNPDYALQTRDLQTLVSTLTHTLSPQNPQAKLSIFLRIQQAIKGQTTQFYDMLLYGEEFLHETLHISFKNQIKKLHFQISPSAFFQPNTFQAEKLYSLALEMGNLQPHQMVYDLYCGIGTLGIAAASFGAKVIGVELSPDAVVDAQANSALNSIQQIEIFQGNVQEVLKNKTFPLADICFVDPPRAGLTNEALENLIALSPKKIIYISCHPQTQGENCKTLIESGYTIDAIQPVDQFPHTPHIENIILLTRAPSSL